MQHRLHRYTLVALLALPLLWLLAGCAHVAFEHGTARLEDRALVFGRILLETDGEESVVSTFSTPVLIRNIESADEPGLVTTSFDKDGRFYWSLPPGRYQLSLVLTPYSEGVRSYAFTLAKSRAAYYFGDLRFVGKKRFNTLGGANIKDITPRMDDELDSARDEFRRRNPQLQSVPVERLLVRDMRLPDKRGDAYSEALAAVPPCCNSLAQIAYKPLAMAQSGTEAVGPQSPVFDFPQGRSRFIAWELPAYSKPYTIDLRSMVTPSGMPGTGQFYIFSPAVMVLDAQFHPVFNQEQGVFYPVPAAMLPPRSASLQAELPMTQQTASARYLLLYTTRAIIEGNWKTFMPGFSPVAGGVIPTGIPSAVQMEPAISGLVELTLKPQ